MFKAEQPPEKRSIMGFWSFMKKIFSASSHDEAELEEYRVKHGIDVGDIKSDTETKSQPGREDYDVWEDLRNMRMNFFFGSWVTRKFRPIGEDKLKKQLDDLEKKRREEAERNKQIEG
jgi:hypothetical protein